MHPFYRLSGVVLRTVFRTYFRWSVFHPERVPANGPAILAANHASFLDPPLIGSALTRDIHYLARESLFKVPVLGMALKRLNCVPVDRESGGAGLKIILERLLRGNAILLFPEGTRSLDGRLAPARPGIGLTVIKSAAVVVPLRVFGTFEAFGRHMRFPAPYPVALKFGSPIGFERLRDEARTCSKPRLKAIYQEAADEIHLAIARLEPCEDKFVFP